MGANTVVDFQFVQLDRTFHELSRQEAADDEFDFSEAFHVRGNLTWADLFKAYRTVILSEAGSGKTEEIRQAARTLRAEGKAAFFLRLEHVSSNFDDAFEAGSIDEFEAWLRSEEEGWLFLDSIDEARLKSPLDFASAVRRLGTRVKIAAQRAHIIITGRTHAWRAKSDAQLCESQFPFGASTQTISKVVNDDAVEDNEDTDKQASTIRTERRIEPVFKIVALDDLNRDQIEKFARARGVSDTKALLSDFERADAWSFAARPQDLEEVVGFWLENGRIGRRLELMKASIDRRLTERSQDRAETNPMSVATARDGARLAAAATTLTHNPIIQVPDGTENQKGIPLQDVLSDWDNRDRSTLLSFPVFDEAIYATVRFHHRSVREYLTADWLAGLLRASVSRRAVEALLFKKQYGLEVVVPTMRPVLPWLALLDEKVRERLRRVSPEVLFEGGDPSSLPLQTRKEILAEVCQQIARGVATINATSYAAVQRFANLDIVDDIRRLLERYPSNDEIQGFLARMIWLGALKDLVPEATKIALSTGYSKYTRIAAFKAVVELGQTGVVSKLRSDLLDETEEFDRDWLAELISEGEPTPQTYQWFLTSVAKARAKEQQTIDRLAGAAADFVRGVDVEALPHLLRGISQLLGQEPFIERPYCQVSFRHAWLLQAAAVGAQKLIEARHPFSFDPTILGILFGLRVGREWYTDLHTKDFKFEELLQGWPALNRASFWHDVEFARSRVMLRPGDRLIYFGQASVFGAFWSFNASDFDYVCEQIAQQSSTDNKLVALSVAFNSYVKESRKTKWRRQMKNAASCDAEVQQALDSYLRPPARNETWQKEERKWRRQSAAHRKREAENREKSREWLTSHVEDIRHPKLEDPTAISQAQLYLHERTREKEESSNKWGGGRWEDLVPEYGEDVAVAYRDAAVGYWRRYKPILRSEGAATNSTPWSVVFGLTGLSIEAGEQAGWPSALSQHEVQLACRYACHELNGFPNWFPKLFVKWPKVAAAVLLKEIEDELSVETMEQETHYVLSDVSWSGQWAWAELAPGIMSLLARSNPKNSGTLSKLLAIAQGSEISDAQLAQLARSKLSDKNVTHAERWFAIWVGVEPDEAIAALRIHLVGLPDKQAQTSFAMGFITALFGGRSEKQSARSAFHTAGHLKDLYLLIHKYIRKDDDIERAGKGVYSPTLRDDAQNARNALFELLNKLTGKDAFFALREIAENPPDEEARGWLTRLVRQKAEQDADYQPWIAKQVREFNDRLDRTPRDHRELADVVVLKLLDLKEDLENGDTSIAAVLQKVERETEMRNFIANDLRGKAFGRYNIPQEDELADAKRPDLRFYGPGIAGAVPAELKLADAGWSGPDLFERLENQLAGDYLRDASSSRGIFVLVYRGLKQTWQHPETKEALNFHQLVDALQSHWTKISPKYPNVDDITVVGIDLTKRFKPATGHNAVDV